MAHMDYSGDSPCLVDKWHVDDVQEYHPWVTDEQAVKVLETMARHHDASIGYTFELIDIWVDRLYPEPQHNNTGESHVESIQP